MDNQRDRIMVFMQKWPKCTKDDCENFSLDDWKRIWASKASRKWGLSKFVTKKIIETADDFETLCWHIKQFWRTEDTLRKIALDKMTKVGTFKDWRTFYQRGYGPWADFALEQMRKIGGFNNWLKVFEEHPYHSLLKKIALQELITLGKSTDWQKVLHKKQKGSKIYKIASMLAKD